MRFPPLFIAPVFLGLVFMGLVFFGCESAEDRLDRVLDDAAACETGDTCMVGGYTDCSCGAAFNAEHEAEVEAAADAVSCCDMLGNCVAVDCIALVNPRCEDGRCVADEGQ